MTATTYSRQARESHERKWYWSHNGHRHGPFSWGELRERVCSGDIVATTLVWHNGLKEWVSAIHVDGLLSHDPVSREETCNSFTPGHVAATLQNAREHAERALRRFSEIDYRRDVFPNVACIQSICQESSFFCVLGLGIVPLLIGTLSRQDYQLTMFALFFAVLWGLVFRHTVVRSLEPWKWVIGSLLFTGLVGIPGLQAAYRYLLPSAYLELAESEHAFVSLFGFIVQVGLCEELCKAVPVLAYIIFHRNRLNLQTALLVGVYSGLGFAAFENVMYSQVSAEIAANNVITDAAAGVKGAIITVLLRSLSLVFWHAVWAGIVAYFAIGAATAVKGDVTMFIVGVALAATLHGVYDWLTSIQLTFATLVVGVSYPLFYGYVSKLGSASSA